MSLAEVKASVAGMSVEERLEVAALIAHLNRAEDPGYPADLHRRMSAMDSGRETNATALRQLHDRDDPALELRIVDVEKVVPWCPTLGHGSTKRNLL